MTDDRIRQMFHQTGVLNRAVTHSDKKLDPAEFSVLVVDDEQFVRQILTRIIRRDGYHVSEAVNGIDALDMLEEQAYDLVIADIKMPEMGGLELLQQIRAQFPQTRVILITGYSDDSSAREATAAGADHFITKPFKNIEISRTLARLVATQSK